MTTLIDYFKNTLILGDCLPLLSNIPDDSVDLIYMDPPFSSNSKYWGISDPNSEISGIIHAYFNDVWRNEETYLNYLEERLIQMRKILKPTGSLFFHCDPRWSHYIKVRLDEIFGKGFSQNPRAPGYRNEIAWCYSQGGKGREEYGRKHDIIFWYTKGDSWTFNKFDEPRKKPIPYLLCPECDGLLNEDNKSDVRIPFYASTIKSSFKKISPTGRLYREATWPPGVNKDGSPKGKTYKYYADEGRMPNDWMTDIPSRHDQKYPTQKPLRLLRRIIATFSNRNDIVLDPFMGGATTCIAAALLNRNFIGIEISAENFQTAVERIATYHSDIKYKPIKTKDIFKEKYEELQLKKASLNMGNWYEFKETLNPYQYQDFMILALGGIPNPRRSGDGGIDGWMEDESRGLIQVKKWTNPVDAKTIDELAGVMIRNERTFGFVIGESFSDAAIEAVEKHRDKQLNITLVTEKDIIRGTASNPCSASSFRFDLQINGNKIEVVNPTLLPIRYIWWVNKNYEAQLGPLTTYPNRKNPIKNFDKTGEFDWTSKKVEKKARGETKIEITCKAYASGGEVHEETISIDLNMKELL
jgi:DNA modification methylase